MGVERAGTELRELLPEAEVGEPVYAQGSWMITLRLCGLRITVEHAPALGLFGIATDGGIGGSQEIYRDVAEVAERARALCSKRQLCSPGTISAAAYAWSKQEADRRSVRDPDWAEYAAIVQAFERRAVAS